MLAVMRSLRRRSVALLLPLLAAGLCACRPRAAAQDAAPTRVTQDVAPAVSTAAPTPARSTALQASATPAQEPGATAPASSEASAPRPGHAVRAAVRCDRAGRKISDQIFGIAWDLGEAAPQSFRMGATTRRWGGNAASRYNPEIGAWNSANDWFWENHGITNHHTFLKQNKDNHLTSVFTVPMLGWVAKDKTSYTFSVRKHGPQQKADPQKPDAGNGLDPTGKPLAPGPPETTSLAAPPALVAKWVSELKAARDAGREDVSMYILDNEPALWNSTHRDVHPEPVTYDELLDRTFRYGDAVRAADPTPRIAGPAEWGWPGYLFSAKDAVAGFQQKPDRLAHGDVPLSAYYLRKVREHERRTGKKLLDLFDLHVYPQATGVFSDKADPATAALRLRQTRGLWDPTYRDESWIRDVVMLLPRMRRWVDENAPGVGLMIGEWNFGGEPHQSGALAAAEALGKFAEYGVDAAYYWRVPKDRSAAYWAFRAYRDFDDHGARFQDELAAVAQDVDRGARVYVSRDASGKKLVAMLLNFSVDASFTAELALEGCAATARVASTRVFDYRDAATTGLTARPAGQGVRVTTGAAPTVQADVAPYALSVLEVTLE